MLHLVLFCLSFLDGSTSKPLPPKNTTILGVTQTVYTDSLPPSPTCTYYVAGDITLQGNFDLHGITFLLKSDFRRNYIFDKQTNNRIKQANGVVFGTNIRLCKARVNLDNCTLTAADSGMWGDVYIADSSSKLRLFQTNIQDSYNGIVQIDNSQIVADQSHFLNNYVSLQLAGNRDTVRYCSFSAKPKTMKMPFDSVAATDYYYSFAHIKNSLNKHWYWQSQTNYKNIFHRAVYGILATEKHQISTHYSLWMDCKLAAIFHQNGALQFTDSCEIQMPVTHENTIQLHTERRKWHLPDSSIYGIYADHCHDELNDESILSARQPIQSIGYYGFNTKMSLADCMIENCSTGLWLEGTSGTYSLVRNRFWDNIVGLRIERNNDFFLSLTCNDFITRAIKGTKIYAPRTGVWLTGSGRVNYNSTINSSTLGSCGNSFPNDYPNNNLIFNYIPQVFTFFRNELSMPIRYSAGVKEFQYLHSALVFNIGLIFNQENICTQELYDCRIK